MMRKWTISALTGKHQKSEFDCGNDQLNTFIRTLASQYQKKDIARTFVATAGASKIVDGYYSLSVGKVELSFLPEEERKKLPHHPVPVVHIGRLAVSKAVQGRRLGEVLLMDALARSLRVADEFGVYAVEVVAIDPKAASFYGRYGFASLIDDVHHMYLPIKTLRKLQ